MPRLSILRKALRDLRWQVFWYGAGLALMAVLVVYVYPGYSAQLKDFQIPEALRGLVGDVDLATGKGFISAEVFSWYPLILVVFAIMAGTAAVAGEEEAGTLDLVLSYPVSRSRFLLEKLAALLLALLGICALIYAGWLVSVPFVDIDVGLGELAVATLNFVPLIAFFQVFSLWAGVTLPTRGLATGAAAALAVPSYFINYIATTVEAMEPLRVVSVFYHYHGTDVLTRGVHWGSLALLCGLYFAFAGWALVSFQRRDLGVGATPLRLPAWPFRRPAEATK
ncbi:MAG TPA: ABC transporter permease subunit [Dehalococcoidia bacterium]|nr:ABC transporter permease subunit [Dehalococcoidia bacterium]